MLSLHEIFLRLTVAAVLARSLGLSVRCGGGLRGFAPAFCLPSNGNSLPSYARLRTVLAIRVRPGCFQYCAGIGFLGAGAIIRGSGGAIGMTTAATIL